MINSFKNLIPLIVILLLAFACERGKKAEKVVSVDSLRTQLQVLNDSLYKDWHEMKASDDQKLNYVKRLLQEMSYSYQYDKALHDSVLRVQEELFASRFQNPYQVRSEKIDAYDASTDRLILLLNQFIQASPEHEKCSLCKELYTDIKKANDDVIIYRKHYDEKVRAYNDFIKKHKDELLTINPAYDTLKTVSSFQLIL